MTQEEAKEIYKTYFGFIERKGAKDLLEWIEKKGFFEAPASARHHGAYEGGLVVHSINVFRRILQIKENEQKALEKNEEKPRKYSLETLAIVSLLHDLCKTDAYIKQEDGTYRPSRHFPAGHGEKSVFMVLPFMALSEEEILAIRWHMGAYDFCAKGGSYDLGNAFNQSRLAVMLHIADMEATHFDERED